ncbi:hypothetical protein ACET3Z_013950 [Daucus carota]
MVVGCFVGGAAAVDSRFDREGGIILAVVVELMDLLSVRLSQQMGPSSFFFSLSRVTFVAAHQERIVFWGDWRNG